MRRRIAVVQLHGANTAAYRMPQAEPPDWKADAGTFFAIVSGALTLLALYERFKR